MSAAQPLLAALRQLPGFLGFVLSRFAIARIALGLTLALLALEYCAFSLMIPLSAGPVEPGAQAAVGVIHDFWKAVAQAIQVPASQATWIWMFLLLLAARIVLGYLHVLLTYWVARQVHRHLSDRAFERVLVHEPMVDIYRKSIGYYLTLAGDDTFRAGTIVNTALQALTTLASVFVGFILLFLFSEQIFFWTAVFLIICGAAVAFAFAELLHVNARMVDMSREARTSYIEALNSLRSIRSMASERFFLQSYNQQIKRYVVELCKIEAMRGGMKSMPAAIALFVGVVAFWPGTARVEGLTASAFLAATTLLIRIFMSLGAFVSSMSVLLMDIRAAKDIHEILGPSHVIARTTVGGALDGPPLRIVLRGVSYGYREGENILSGLDYCFESGETVAIVGPSGSGKSTLADIILDLVQPDEGAVEVRGLEGAAGGVRHHIVLVEQQTKVFSTSIRENLLLGLTRSDGELWAALQAVELAGFVQKMPAGLSSTFEYQGANISGGQRQRLGIARALVRHPKVLILDEATGALDPKTRELVIVNLRRIMRDGILIFITHDEAIAALADHVLDLGKKRLGETSGQ